MLDAASSSCLRWDWGVQEPSGFHKLEIGDSPGALSNKSDFTCVLRGVVTRVPSTD